MSLKVFIYFVVIVSAHTKWQTYYSETPRNNGKIFKKIDKSLNDKVF